MNRVVTVIGVLAFVTTIALAQSSGNFTYGDTGGLHCILNQGNGAITGGATCSSGTDCSGNGCTPIPAAGGNLRRDYQRRYKDQQRQRQRVRHQAFCCNWPANGRFRAKE
jgi:hypothetical protein